MSEFAVNTQLVQSLGPLSWQSYSLFLPDNFLAWQLLGSFSLNSNLVLFPSTVTWFFFPWQSLGPFSPDSYLAHFALILTCSLLWQSIGLFCPNSQFAHFAVIAVYPYCFYLVFIWQIEIYLYTLVIKWSKVTSCETDSKFKYRAYFFINHLFGYMYYQQQRCQLSISCQLNISNIGIMKHISDIYFAEKDPREADEPVDCVWPESAEYWAENQFLCKYCLLYLCMFTVPVNAHYIFSHTPQW